MSFEGFLNANEDASDYTLSNWLSLAMSELSGSEGSMAESIAKGKNMPVRAQITHKGELEFTHALLREIHKAMGELATKPDHLFTTVTQSE